MSPISTVGLGSPAPSDISGCTNDFDDQQPFSPDSGCSSSNGPRAIAMVVPTVQSGTMPADQFRVRFDLSLSNCVNYFTSLHLAVIFFSLTCLFRFD